MLEEDHGAACADDGMPLLCQIDIGVTGSRLVDVAQLIDHRDTTEEIVASRMDCPLHGGQLYARKTAGMESPQTAVRLMTPTAVLIAVGAFYPNPPDWWVFVCLQISRQLLAAIILRTNIRREKCISRRMDNAGEGLRDEQYRYHNQTRTCGSIH